MGFQKADNAEAETVQVEKLYEVYGTEYGTINTSDTVLQELISNLFPDNKVISTVESAFTDDTLPEAIVKAVYYPSYEGENKNQEQTYEKNTSVSSAIAERILVHRIKKTYDGRELTAILMGISSNK